MNPIWVVLPFLALALFVIFLAWLYNEGAWSEVDTRNSFLTIAFLGGLGLVAYVMIVYMTREKDEVRQHRVIMSGLRLSPYVILVIYLLLKYFGLVS